MRHLTMSEVEALPPLGLLPDSDGNWSLVYPIAVVLDAVAIGRVYVAECSPQ
jgi:hypothetical protein